MSPADQVYVIGKNGITGFALADGQLQETSDSKIEILKDGINQCVHRAKLQNRYFMASEENRFGKNGRVLSVDFDSGKVRIQKTPTYAFTSAGESADYYFVSTVRSGEAWLAAYSPNLELLDTYTFETPVLGYDFSVEGNTVYMLGVPLAENDNYATCLYVFEMENGKLVLKQSNLFDASDSVARYFGDSAVVGDLLITSFPGTINLATGERSYESSSVVVQNLTTGERSEIATQRSEPYNLYDLKDGYIGFDHASGSSPELGFTLVNLADHSSVYVPLDMQPDPSGEREYFKSLARLDGERVIALTSKAMWIYNYQTGQIESSYPLPDHIEWPFEIWVRP